MINLFFIVGGVLKFIVHCLIPIDPCTQPMVKGNKLKVVIADMMLTCCFQFSHLGVPADHDTVMSSHANSIVSDKVAS